MKLVKWNNTSRWVSKTHMKWTFGKQYLLYIQQMKGVQVAGSKIGKQAGCGAWGGHEYIGSGFNTANILSDHVQSQNADSILSGHFQRPVFGTTTVILWGHRSCQQAFIFCKIIQKRGSELSVNTGSLNYDCLRYVTVWHFWFWKIFLINING